jgi:hypothetical protein
VALGELFDEKNRGRKSCVRVPLKTYRSEHNELMVTFLFVKG